MRLVDADLMRARVKPYNISDEDWSVTGGTAIRLMHTLIDAAPTVDAVAVTRCKDCGNCRELNREDSRENLYVEGVLWCTQWDEGVYPDDFCSYGVK
jgi:hypothetical protein